MVKNKIVILILASLLGILFVLKQIFLKPIVLEKHTQNQIIEKQNTFIPSKISSESDKCIEYKDFSSEEDFFKKNNGKILWISLYLDNPQQKFVVQLFFNKMPKPRVQTLTVFKRIGVAPREEVEPIDLPTNWRHLAGSEFEKVKSYFSQDFSISNLSVAFEEYEGVGGKKILWEKNAGITKCD